MDHWPDLSWQLLHSYPIVWNDSEIDQPGALFPVGPFRLIYYFSFSPTSFYLPNVNSYAWLLSLGHQTSFFFLESSVWLSNSHCSGERKKRFCFNKQFAVWHTMLRKATLSPAVNSALIAKLDKKMIESVCYTFVGLPRLLMEMLLFIQQCNNTFCNLWMHIPQITKGNIVD